MTENPRATFADWLILFFAGPKLGEAIAGDLKEQAASSQPKHWGYQVSVLRSLPGIIRLGWSNVSSLRLGSEIGLGLLALMLVWIWEIWVARVFAWPIALSVDELSPLSAAATCKLAYLGLFTVGVGLLLSGSSALMSITQSSWRLRVQRFVVWAVAGLIPGVYLVVYPGPHDGDPLFRYVQFTLVLLTGFVVAITGRSKLQPA